MRDGCTASLHCAVNRTVVAVMTSVGFEDMLENWLCFVDELQHPQLLHHHHVQAARLSALAQRGIAAFVLRGPRNTSLPGVRRCLRAQEARDRPGRPRCESRCAAQRGPGRSQWQWRSR